MSEPWDHVEAPLLAQADRLDAFREYTQCFFMDALATICREKGWEEPQYQRRPSIGLRLESLDLTLAVRPAWHKCGKRPGTLRTELSPSGGSRS
jgi:hypothetical protein